MPDTSDKTEPATPHRRREARQKGQIAKSVELNTAFVLLGSFLALRYLAPLILKHMEQIMRISFSTMGQISFAPENLFHYGLKLIFAICVMVMPLMLIIAVCAVVSNYLQVGALHSTHIIKPQFSRINPVSGMKRYLSLRVLAELTKSLLKISITALVVYFIIKAEINRIMLTMDMAPLQSVGIVAGIAFRIGIRIGIALACMAVLDYIYQRWEYEKSIRMTRQEIKEELIRHEGRPEVRARIRSIQRQLAMRRMMQEVPKADVVITNPTTLAIALRYDPKKMIAPTVVAKGARLIAQKILEIARENNVPVLENKPLAQTIFKTVEIGKMIPLALYQAVADILAYVWRMGKLKRKIF